MDLDEALEKILEFLNCEIEEAQQECKDIRNGERLNGVYNGKVIALKDTAIFIKKLEKAD